MVADIESRVHRLIDVSQHRNSRYKGAGMRVDDRNQARCSAEMGLMIRETNAENDGTSALPWGLYVFRGDLKALKDPPPEIQDVPFAEVIPADKKDSRAAKLHWNESGTLARMPFTAVAHRLGISPVEGSSLWIDAYQTLDVNDNPVIVMPLGHKVRVEAVDTRPEGEGTD